MYCSKGIFRCPILFIIVRVAKYVAIIVFELFVNNITTKAVSKKQAINNILYRLKVNYGFYTNNDLTLDDYYLEEVPDTQKIYRDEIKEITKQGHIKKCDNCGTQLTDSGECPVCDLGDIDYLI